MNAAITTRGAEGIRRSHRDREEKNGLAYGFKAVTLRKGKLEDLVEVRVAFTKGGTCYAVAWIHQPPEYCPDGAGMWGQRQRIRRRLRTPQGQRGRGAGAPPRRRHPG